MKEEEGKVTCIKSTLASLSTYLMFLFTVPASVEKRLDKLVWQLGQVCSPMEKSGLGIRCFPSSVKLF